MGSHASLVGGWLKEAERGTGVSLRGHAKVLATQPFHLCQDPEGGLGRVQEIVGPREGYSVGSRPSLVYAVVLG